MAQHDYNLINQNGGSFRTDLNNALTAVVTNNSGLTAPATTFAFMIWVDETNNLIKRRDSVDTAWVTLGSFNGTTWIPYRSGTALGTAAERTIGTGALSQVPDIEDVQNQQGIYLLSTGSAGAYAINLVPAIANYAEGQRFVFKANHANPDNPTFDVNSKGAGALVWPNGDALVTGDILIDQHVMVQRLASTFMVLGSRSIASQTQAEAGLQNTRLMTALRTDQALENRIASGGILQADIGAAQIGQGELKTAIGEVSVTANNNFQNLLLILPGGEYGFYVQTKKSTGIVDTLNVQMVSTTAFGASYGTNIQLQVDTTISFQIVTLSAQHRYFQASPPYDMGDGNVMSFIFAIINNATGLIEAAYHAPDPPWANNGPTNIRPDRIDSKTGKQYKTIQTLGADKLRLMDPDFIIESEMEITAAFKNSDMALIPHPFIGNDLTGKTVVLLDPMSVVVERLERIKNAGGDAEEILYGNYLNIGNSELNRARPPGVMSVSIAMK